MEQQIYDYLCSNCIGKDNLIKNRVLRGLFGIRSDRTLRKVIQNIREDSSYKRIIGSESGRKGGFYICDTKEETIETINNIKHRANKMLRMTHILEWKANQNGS